MNPRLFLPVAMAFFAVAVFTVLQLTHGPAPPASPPPGLGGLGDSTTGPPGSTEAETDWHFSTNGLAFGPGPASTCALCHWNPSLKFWQASLAATGPTAAQSKAWNVTVRPYDPVVGLVAVQARTDTDFVASTQSPSNPNWAVGSSWDLQASVPQGAGLLVQVRAQAVFPDINQALNQTLGATGVTTSSSEPQNPDLAAIVDLIAKGPGGQEVHATGPEPDMRILLVPDAAPGDWSIQAQLVAATYQGRALQQGNGYATVEVLRGPVKAAIPGPLAALDNLTVSPEARFTFPARPDGSPPPVQIRTWLYKDHHAFYGQTTYDMAVQTASLVPVAGPEPAPISYSKGDMDRLWGSQDHYVLDTRSESVAEAYATDGSGRIQDYVTGRTPYYELVPGKNGLLPGTTRLHFEVTWNPPLDLPNLAVRFSPRNTPHFFEAKRTNGGPGQASFDALVDAAWWDDPKGPQEGWDAHAYRALPTSGQVAYSLQYSLTATAYR